MYKSSSFRICMQKFAFHQELCEHEWYIQKENSHNNESESVNYSYRNIIRSQHFTEYSYGTRLKREKKIVTVHASYNCA